MRRWPPRYIHVSPLCVSDSVYRPLWRGVSVPAQVVQFRPWPGAAAVATLAETLGAFSTCKSAMPWGSVPENSGGSGPALSGLRAASKLAGTAGWSSDAPPPGE